MALYCNILVNVQGRRPREACEGGVPGGRPMEACQGGVGVTPAKGMATHDVHHVVKTGLGAGGHPQWRRPSYGGIGVIPTAHAGPATFRQAVVASRVPHCRRPISERPGAALAACGQSGFGGRRESVAIHHIQGMHDHRRQHSQDGARPWCQPGTCPSSEISRHAW